MQTMTMKQGIPTANPMTSASSFSVKQNDGDNGIQQKWANTEVERVKVKFLLPFNCTLLCHTLIVTK